MDNFNGMLDNFRSDKIQEVVSTTLSNFTLTVSTFLIEGISGVADKQRWFSTEFNQRVLEYLQQTLNYGLCVMPTSNSKELQIDGLTFTGDAALLLNGSADISLELNVFVPYRVKYFALLQPLFTDKMQIFFRQPPPSSVRNIFTQSFTPSVWLTILGLLVLAWILIVSTNLVYKRLQRGLPLSMPNFSAKQGNDAEDNGDELPRNSGPLWLISFLALQGWHKRPHNLCFRISCLIGSCAGIILLASYSANLYSIFSIEVKPINNLAQFTSSALRLFASDTSDTTRDIFHDSISSSCSTEDLGISKVIDYIASDHGHKLAVDKFSPFPSAFLSFSYRFYTKNLSLPSFSFDTSFCGVNHLDAMSTPFHLGWILSKESLQIREALNRKIIALRTSGILWREVNLYISSYRPTCEGIDYSSRKRSGMKTRLTLRDLLTPFLLLVIAFGVSPLIMVCEKWNLT